MLHERSLASEGALRSNIEPSHQAISVEEMLAAIGGPGWVVPLYSFVADCAELLLHEHLTKEGDEGADHKK